MFALEEDLTERRNTVRALQDRLGVTEAELLKANRLPVGLQTIGAPAPTLLVTYINHEDFRVCSTFESMKIYF